MEAYQIFLRFRSKDVNAFVYKHEDFSLIYFSDRDIIIDFGGRIEADKNNKIIAVKTEAKDALDLYRAIEAQLR